MPLKEQARGHEPEEGNTDVKCLSVGEQNVHDSFYQNIGVKGAGTAIILSPFIPLPASPCKGADLLHLTALICRRIHIFSFGSSNIPLLGKEGWGGGSRIVIRGFAGDMFMLIIRNENAIFNCKLSDCV